MNNLLSIKATFEHEKNNQIPGPKNLRARNETTVGKIETLINDLNKVRVFYEKEPKFIRNCLVDVFYNDIIAKSNRVIELLKDKGQNEEHIVGARFTQDNPGFENHIITYYVSLKAVIDTITNLKIIKNFIIQELNGIATSKNFDYGNDSIEYSKYGLSKTKIRNLVIDCSVVEHIDVPTVEIDDTRNDYVITFYKTEVQMSDILQNIGLNNTKASFIFRTVGENTLSVDRRTFSYIREKIPYLVSMVATDIATIQYEATNCEKTTQFSIPNPKNEPTIGVIDTLFDNNVYFSKWVEYKEELDFFEKTTVLHEHYNHGTSVASIIVDGPTLNKDLDDECGRFKVRHFGVCAGQIAPTRLVKKIQKIVEENPDIHVWNLSLGTQDEVSKNFISFDGAFLDNLQNEKNIIFVVSGTNDNNFSLKNRVGSPADSLNSIVVNSVKRNGTPASYSRKGPILSFFNKPDLAYYGGDADIDERINVYSPDGLDKQYGTSFAAPWISRKLCYLIDVLGFPREIAKALLIDSAAAWSYKKGAYKNKNIIGYGVVPIKISSVVECENNEIRFTLFDNASSYRTALYSIPVPKEDNNRCYYSARATLCYFPKCNRLQGVDYTQRELSLKFGVVKGKIEDINYNTQDSDEGFPTERKSREEFRKWENTKFISSLDRDSRIIGKEVKGDGLWGVSVTSKSRSEQMNFSQIRFGLVITLKHQKGENRINDFKHSCLLRGFIVNEINIENKIDIYAKAQEEISFDE